MTTTIPADDVWKHYIDSLAETRKLLHGHSWSATDKDRDYGVYYFLQLQAVAFNLFVAARPDYPTLYTHLASEPNVYSWGIASADFKYRYAVLDGSRRYRIWGTRGSARFLEFQPFRGTWGMPGSGKLATIEVDRITKPDGTFEIFLGEGTDHPLDPSLRMNMVMGREAFLDLENDVPAEVHIDLADDKGRGEVVVSAADLAEKLKAAAAFVHLVISQFAVARNELMLSDGPINQFVQNSFQKNPGIAKNAAVYNPSFIYDITEDEALILEWDVPESFSYWSIQAADIWHQTTDYVYHQSAMNALEVAVDADKHVRVVLSLKDPGVANWLDPVGLSHGMVICRFYHSSNVVVPHARKVPFDEVVQELPKGTVMRTPEERAKILARRAEIIRARYGH